MVRGVLLLVAAVIVLGGCGDDDQQPTATDPSGHPPIEAVQAALREVKSLRTTGRNTDDDGTFRVDQAVTSDERVVGSARRSDGTTLELVGAGRKLYFRADELFWIEMGDLPPRLAAELADQWVEMPEVEDFLDSITESTPQNMAHCLTAAAGYRPAGTAMVDGRRTFVYVDDGDDPGTAPGKLYVAAEGPPLPVRVTQTGPYHQPTVPECSTTGDTTRSADVRIGGYDKPVDAELPKSALNFEELAALEGRQPATT